MRTENLIGGQAEALSMYIHGFEQRQQYYIVEEVFLEGLNDFMDHKFYAWSQ